MLSAYNVAYADVLVANEPIVLTEGQMDGVTAGIYGYLPMTHIPLSVIAGSGAIGIAKIGFVGAAGYWDVVVWPEALMEPYLSSR